MIKAKPRNEKQSAERREEKRPKEKATRTTKTNAEVIQCRPQAILQHNRKIRSNLSTHGLGLEKRSMIKIR